MAFWWSCVWTQAWLDDSGELEEGGGSGGTAGQEGHADRSLEEFCLKWKETVSVWRGEVEFKKELFFLFFKKVVLMVFFHVVGCSLVQKQKAFRREGEIWRSSVSE